MTKCPTITFQVAKVPNTLAKNISTKVFFTNTPRDRHDYIDIRLRWIWKQYIQLPYS